MYWPNGLAPTKRKAFEKFLRESREKFEQMMANRLVVGTFRYDKERPVQEARYLTRLKAELRAYSSTGNLEHMINVANYAFLETVAPEHPQSHFEHVGRSVTRDVLGMRFDARGMLLDPRTGNKIQGD